MSLNFPNPLYLRQPEPFNLVSYCDGPLVSGLPLASGEIFSGRWAFWMSEDYHFFTSQTNDYVLPTNTGSPVPLFSLLTQRQKNRIEHISCAFNNSGQLCGAIELDDNIHLDIQSGGSINQYGWPGSSPCLFNSLMVNAPYSLPTRLDRIYRTGEIGCFYQNGQDIYLRSSYDNFSSGILYLTGMEEAFNLKRIEVGNYNKQPYVDLLPYNFALLFLRNDGREAKAIFSRTYLEFAADNFIKYPTGSRNVFNSGYAAAKTLINSFYSSTGNVYAGNKYLYNNFLGIETGMETTEASQNILVDHQTITSPGDLFYFYAPGIYFYNDFLTIETGLQSFITGNLLSSGHSLSANTRVSGVIF